MKRQLDRAKAAAKKAVAKFLKDNEDKIIDQAFEYFGNAKHLSDADWDKVQLTVSGTVDEVIKNLK